MNALEWLKKTALDNGQTDYLRKQFEATDQFTATNVRSDERPSVFLVTRWKKHFEYTYIEKNSQAFEPSQQSELLS